MPGSVLAVHAGSSHNFSKTTRGSIRLLAGLGVEGDAHCGATTKHRGRLPRDADKPNTRQVHLIHSELHDELRQRGFEVGPGDMGENITTLDVDLLGMPTGALLHVGVSAIVEVTGLRNPCRQLDGLMEGLMAATRRQSPDGSVERLAGVMGIVVEGGEIRPGDGIRVELPVGDRVPLEPV